MPDAYWNTTTGPPGPTLLYDPPFVWAYATNARTFDGSGFNEPLVWSTPNFHGVPFVSVSGTYFTFLCDCTIQVSVEPLFQTFPPSEGIMTFTLSGDVCSTAPYNGSAYGQYSVAFNTVITDLFMPSLWTTPPFRVESGRTLGLTEAGYLGAGEATDVGSSMMITRVA